MVFLIKIEKCKKIDNKRKCICTYGLTGYNCKIKKCNRKDENRCGDNGKIKIYLGKCIIINQKATCKCNEGYIGEFCNILDCTESFCGKNGTINYNFRIL